MHSPLLGRPRPTVTAAKRLLTVVTTRNQGTTGIGSVGGRGGMMNMMTERRASRPVGVASFSASRDHQASSAQGEEEEVRKFGNMSARWWDPHQNPLIAMNIVRVQYIQSILKQRQHQKDKSPPKGCRHVATELAQCKVLDIGCGGGLLSESLVRLGAAHVTGIDPSGPLIEVARSHAARTLSPDALSRLDYRVGDLSMILNDLLQPDPTSSLLVQSARGRAAGGRLPSAEVEEDKDFVDDPRFDLVCLMEVIEHISDIPSLLRLVAQVVHPEGGLVVLSTLNRTMSSYLFSILGAEYVMRYLPTGTHNWVQYRSPTEVQTMMEAVGMDVLSVSGMVWDTSNSPCWLLPHTLSSPAAWNWRLDHSNTSVNWIGTYTPKATT